jgi:glycosyltransferase involved in cell wall biosynthesis
LRRRAPRHDVAIHAPFAGHLYAGGEGRLSGGAELQTFKLARALADQGLRVCHVVFAYDGVEPGEHDGVTVVTQPPDEFSRHLLLYSRSIAVALARADAAVYVQRTAGFETGVVATFARARGRGFVFSSSSITDVSAKPPMPTWASAVAFRTGLRLANEVVVQTADQVEQATRRLGRPPRLIRSFCEPQPAADGEREAFLWIGGLIDYKDPLAYVRLAEQAPEARFWMIGTPRGGWEELASEVARAAARLPNLDLLEPRSRESLFELYRRAVAVVNTSAFEGFPNTFMEGWACGAAALSLNVDPDGIIERHGIGSFAHGSSDALAESARGLWDERLRWGPRAATARRYIADNHDPAVVGADWAGLVRGLTTAGGRTGPVVR